MSECPPLIPVCTTIHHSREFRLSLFSKTLSVSLGVSVNKSLLLFYFDITSCFFLSWLSSHCVVTQCVFPAEGFHVLTHYRLVYCPVYTGQLHCELKKLKKSTHLKKYFLFGLGILMKRWEDKYEQGASKS